MENNQLNAVDVAEYFLYRIPKEIRATGGGMNSIKLHKLLFLAHEEYLFRYQEPLIKNILRAVNHGMMFENVIIGDYDTTLGSRQEKIAFNTNSFSLEKFSTNQLNVLKFIWVINGHIADWYLEMLNHSYQIWKDNWENNNIISNEQVIDSRLQIEKARKNGEEIADKIIANYSKVI